MYKEPDNMLPKLPGVASLPVLLWLENEWKK